MADKESPEEIETLKTKGTHEGNDWDLRGQTLIRNSINIKEFISHADRFERQTQINGGLLPALGFLERPREINHNRYSWNRKKLKISS